jgi:hypothetical protein
MTSALSSHRSTNSTTEYHAHVRNASVHRTRGSSIDGGSAAYSGTASGFSSPSGSSASRKKRAAAAAALAGAGSPPVPLDLPRDSAFLVHATLSATMSAGAQLRVQVKSRRIELQRTLKAQQQALQQAARVNFSQRHLPPITQR